MNFDKDQILGLLRGQGDHDPATPNGRTPRVLRAAQF